MRGLALFFVILIAASLWGQAVPSPEALVPDSRTAIDVAKVILRPIYGEGFVRRKVFTASSGDGIWIVVGKAKAPVGKVVTGGIIEIHVNMADAKITYIHLQL